MDWEAEIAGPALEEDGVPARYRSAVDGEPDGVIDRELTVLFHEGYVEKVVQGAAVAGDEVAALAPRSALSDAKTGGLLTVDGRVFVVRSKPENDGRVWIKLKLEFVDVAG
ncbi:head-tail joining protein [Devosia faecipullorum]|uniref:head-tail joining protein n=1 Tax=Devosia faecipullorum TaxID=2755039 RepID=UPI00187B6417|nr:hypothetical protein [Devosia faecipullorum]MBE7732173.1 hypothetical protein [Devosia faecipullorum]